MPNCIFNDTFESGNFSLWTSTTITNPPANNLTVQTTVVKDGAYAALASAGGASNNLNAASANLTIAAAANKILFAEFWFQLSSAPLNVSGLATGKAVFAFYNGSSPIVALPFSSNTQITLSYCPQNSSSLTFGGSPLPWTPTVGTWYRVRIKLDQSGTYPELTWWVSTDGVTYTEIAFITDLTSGSNGLANAPTQVQLGVTAPAVQERPGWNVYLDDFSLADGSGSILIADPAFLVDRPQNGITIPDPATLTDHTGIHPAYSASDYRATGGARLTLWS